MNERNQIGWNVLKQRGGKKTFIIRFENLTRAQAEAILLAAAAVDKEPTR